MGRRASAAIIILTVLVILSISLAGVSFYLYRNEYTAKTKLQNELEDTKTKLLIAERKFDDAQRKASDLGARLSQAQTEISDLSGNLKAEKESKEGALKRLKQLEADIEQQKATRTDLEKKFSAAQDETKKIQAQLRDLQAQKKDLETKIKELETKPQAQPGVELGNIVVVPDQQNPANPPAPKPSEARPAALALPEARVLVVNKEYNFAVVSLGTKDGVEVGRKFSLFRGDKYIGDVEIAKVHETMSAANFASPELKDKVNEGDRVTPKS